MNDYIISIRNFTKYFRSHWTLHQTLAVSNLSLDIFRGEMLGFIGHNGAGKTTTIKSILGLLRPNTGEFYLDGKKLCSAEQRKTIGYLPEQPYFYEHLTVKESLQYFGALSGLNHKEAIKRTDILLENLNLSNQAYHSVRCLSKGLQQRLGIASAIIHKPSLLFLDEPFSGLDPVGRREIRQLLIDLNKSGTTIFLSSHILSDVQDMCDRVAIIAKGQLRKSFQIQDLSTVYAKGYTITLQHSPTALEFCDKIHAGNKDYHAAQTYQNQLELIFDSYTDAIEVMSEAIRDHVTITSFNHKTASLEDVFMNIVEQECFTQTDCSNS